MRTLKMRSIVTSHWKYTKTNWEHHRSLQLCKELPNNSVLTIIWSFGIWSKLEWWKSWINGCLVSWPEIKKIVILKCHLLLLYATTTNHFLIILWCVMKSQLYMITVTTSSVVRLRRSSKAFPQTKLGPKKHYDHCLVVCCQSDWLQLSESQWNHYIWEVCSANQWDALKTATPAAGIGQHKGPNSFPRQCPTTSHTTKASKVEWIELWSFASSAIFTWPLGNQLLLL